MAASVPVTTDAAGPCRACADDARSELSSRFAAFVYLRVCLRVFMQGREARWPASGPARPAGERPGPARPSPAGDEAFELHTCMDFSNIQDKRKDK